MSSSEEDDTNIEKQAEIFQKAFELDKKNNSFRYQVSGWEDDTEGIEEEKDPHKSPHTEILWAAENGELELVKKLVKENRSLVYVEDKDGYTPLHRACYNDHTKVVEFLIESGSDISSTSVDLWQPLHSACKWNNALIAAKLLDAGADVNCKSKGGQTPLHVAASNGNAKETLQLLLMRKDIKPDLTNDNNETAFDIARRSGKYYKLFEIVDPSVNIL